MAWLPLLLMILMSWTHWLVLAFFYNFSFYCLWVLCCVLLALRSWPWKSAGFPPVRVTIYHIVETEIARAIEMLVVWRSIKCRMSLECSFSRLNCLVREKWPWCWWQMAKDVLHLHSVLSYNSLVGKKKIDMISIKKYYFTFLGVVCQSSFLLVTVITLFLLAHQYSCTTNNTSHFTPEHLESVWISQHVTASPSIFIGPLWMTAIEGKGPWNSSCYPSFYNAWEECVLLI